MPAWVGVPARSAADVLVLTLKLREPHGFGELRAGRFVFVTGAIRPIHVDAISGVARAPWGTTVETMGGIPVEPQSVPRGADWVGAFRMAQTLASRITVGTSYFVRRADSEWVTKELGADLAAMPARFFDLAGKGAYDLLSHGVAEATFSVALRSAGWRVELFGSHLSPGRRLPSTSLFSVLGDFPSESLGATTTWAAAPRLDLLATGAGQLVGGRIGGLGSVRATLRTDDEGRGRLGLEVRRQDVSMAQWTGVRAIVSQPLADCWSASTELEIARPDVATDRGSAWPWGLVALSWRSGTGWEASAAVEAGSNPTRSFEADALLRLSRSLEVP
jgi:hypothetical protein